MGTFSIVHWFIVLAVVALLVGIIPILAADRRKTLTRGAYAIRTLGAYVAIFVMSGLTAAAGSAVLLKGIELVVNVVLGVLIVLWSVHRVQDIGWSKWCTLLICVPGVGIVFWLVLLFTAGRRSDAQVAAAFD